MLQYRNVYLWLLIPFSIVMLAFLPSYWLGFGDAPWRQHLHGLTATLWFCLLIAQPYLVTRGHVDAHRRYGMIALVLAFIAYRDRRLHPAWLAAGAGSLVLFVPMSLGDAQWWRSLADALFTL